jgi:hypothetical protein
MLPNIERRGIKKANPNKRNSVLVRTNAIEIRKDAIAAV